MYTCSRWWSSDAPWYQGMLAERWTTLSPCSAEMGMKVRSATSSRLAKAVNSSRMRSNTSWSKSTRSILLTHTSRWGTRSSEARKAWRRVCSTMPLRASTSTMVRSAVEFPVTMLRVYWMCPGVSAMMNLRAGVAK